MGKRAIEKVDPRVLGRRLRESRRASGFTQNGVAAQLSVPRDTVAAVENGERPPRPDELIGMARLFARPVGDFVGRRETAADFGDQVRAAVRARGIRESPRGLDSAAAELQRLCEDYLHLENLTGAPLRQDHPRRYCAGSAPPVEEGDAAASAERSRLGLGDGPLLCLGEFLETYAGIRAFDIELPSGVAALVCHSDELGHCLAVNARHPEEHRRWSMAHQYGHFLSLRYRSAVHLLANDGPDTDAERFADAFASSLLMPSAGLRRRFNGHFRAVGGKVTAADLCGLARHYLVPLEYMTLRLEKLRLLPEGTWDGLRNGGPGVMGVQTERGLSAHVSGSEDLPFRYRLLAVKAYCEEHITEGQLARLLRVDRVSARMTVREFTHTGHVLPDGEVGMSRLDLATIIADGARDPA